MNVLSTDDDDEDVWNIFWFADSHCVLMVQNGMTKELLSLLERHPVQSGSTIIQHAVFSALRNLAIPGLFRTTKL